MQRKLLYILLLLTVSLSIYAQSADNLVIQAVEKCNQKNYVGALADCSKAINLDAQNAQAYYVRGIAKSNQNMFDDAIADYDRAISIEPRYAAAYANRGYTKIKKGAYTDAIADYDQALDFDPDNVLLYQSRGFAKINTKQFNGAIADFDRVIAATPQYADAFNNRGYAYFQLGQSEQNFRKALADYDKGNQLAGKAYQPFFKYRNEAESALMAITNIPGANSVTITWQKPVVDFNDLPNGVFTTVVPSVPIKIHINSSKPIDKAKVQLQLNGITVSEKATVVDFSQINMQQLASKQFEYVCNAVLTVPKGKSNIQLIYNEATSDILPVNYQPQGLNLYVLSIGTTSNLKYPQKDASDFANIFKNQQGEGKLFQQVYIDSLIGPQAKAAAIAEKIADLGSKNYGPNDVLFVFISSHGDNQDGNLRILGSDFKTTIANVTSLDFKQNILEPLDGAQCKKFIFLDACHSGAGIKATAAEISNAVQKMITAATSTTVITSSSGAESSWEDDTWQNGAFTKALKEGLSGKKAITDGNATVSIDDLFAYLSKRVPELVKQANKKNESGNLVSQTPQMLNPKGNVIIYAN